MHTRFLTFDGSRRLMEIASSPTRAPLSRSSQSFWLGSHLEYRTCHPTERLFRYAIDWPFYCNMFFSLVSLLGWLIYRRNFLIYSYLGHGMSFTCLAQHTRTGKTTVAEIVGEVCSALLQGIKYYLKHCTLLFQVFYFNCRAMSWQCQFVKHRERVHVDSLSEGIRVELQH